MKAEVIARLYQTILERKQAGAKDSYTASLLAGGKNKVLAKYQEEAQELLQAAQEGNKKEVIHESADLLYHWLVLLAACDVSLEEVLLALEQREGLSGLVEKAQRKSHNAKKT